MPQIDIKGGAPKGGSSFGQAGGGNDMLSLLAKAISDPSMVPVFRQITQAQNPAITKLFQGTAGAGTPGGGTVDSSLRQVMQDIISKNAANIQKISQASSAQNNNNTLTSQAINSAASQIITALKQVVADLNQATAAIASVAKSEIPRSSSGGPAFGHYQFGKNTWVRRPGSYFTGEVPLLGQPIRLPDRSLEGWMQTQAVGTAWDRFKSSGGPLVPYGSPYASSVYTPFTASNRPRPRLLLGWSGPQKPYEEPYTPNWAFYSGMPGWSESGASPQQPFRDEPPIMSAGRYRWEKFKSDFRGAFGGWGGGGSGGGGGGGWNAGRFPLGPFWRGAGMIPGTGIARGVAGLISGHPLIAGALGAATAAITTPVIAGETYKVLMGTTASYRNFVLQSNALARLRGNVFLAGNMGRVLFLSFGNYNQNRPTAWETAYGVTPEEAMRASLAFPIAPLTNRGITNSAFAMTTFPALRGFSGMPIGFGANLLNQGAILGLAGSARSSLDYRGLLNTVMVNDVIGRLPRAGLGAGIEGVESYYAGGAGGWIDPSAMLGYASQVQLYNSPAARSGSLAPQLLQSMSAGAQSVAEGNVFTPTVYNWILNGVHGTDSLRHQLGLSKKEYNTMRAHDPLFRQYSNWILADQRHGNIMRPQAVLALRNLVREAQNPTINASIARASAKVAAIRYPGTSVFDQQMRTILGARGAGMSMNQYSILRHITYGNFRFGNVPSPDNLVPRYNISTWGREANIIHNQFGMNWGLTGDIVAAAKKVNLSPALLGAIVTQESHGNIGAIGSGTSGPSYGLMQVTAGAFKQVTGRNLTKADIHKLLTNPQYNLEIGAKYAAWSFAQEGGQEAPGLAAYNAGVAGAAHGAGAAYAAKIMNRLARSGANQTFDTLGRMVNNAAAGAGGAGLNQGAFVFNALGSIVNKLHDIMQTTANQLQVLNGEMATQGLSGLGMGP